MEKYIDAAVEQFRTLITEQLARQNRMEQDNFVKDFKNADKIIIGACGGDGIGPIITKGAQSVLEYLLADEIKSGRVELRAIDGLTIENRLACGKAIPDDVLAKIKECDVILKGPTTTPKGGTMESANVAMRRELDLYANVRPVSVPELNIDWIFYRENTEGEYVLGSRGVELPGKLAMDFKVTTNAGTKRIARAAFEYAKNNGKTNVAIVTKANIMKKTDGKFSELCHEVARDYPDITADLYGDIITDEAAQIQGGVGTAGSANIGDRYAMFEAIHGSAPRMIERGDGKYANPSSMLKASEMLLRHIAMPEKADKLAKAMKICTETEKKVVITGRSTGATCDEFADYVMDTLSRI